MYREYLRLVLSDPTLQVPRSYVELGPCSCHIVSTGAVLLEPAMLRDPRVIELNVGTICASLPFLPAFYQHHRLKPSQVAALKTITNKIKPFRFGRKMSDDRLETGILGSAQGEGKFLQSGDLTDITGSTDTTQLTEK